MLSVEKLKEITVQEGASLFGVADLSQVKQGETCVDEEACAGDELVGRFEFAVSVAVRLSRAVLDGIIDRPTKLYFHHYRNVNMLLDRIALKLALEIQKEGYKALPVPASQIIDWDRQRGHLSHKAVAEAAGLGWIGRNNLLVTPEFGSQVRLVTILTDAPLEPGGPLERDCGDCVACVDVCPAGAIARRREDFDHIRCYEALKEFRRKGYVGQYVCGICVKACPAFGAGGRR